MHGSNKMKSDFLKLLYLYKKMREVITEPKQVKGIAIADQNAPQRYGLCSEPGASKTITDVNANKIEKRPINIKRIFNAITIFFIK